MYYLFLYIFAVRDLGAICTHPQEHKLHSTAIGVCNGCGMLVHWSSTSWDRAKSVRVSQPIPAPME
jgi:hypothetical protein